MLVIVEDGHATFFDQRTLYLKTLRCLDVFEVDTTKGIGNTLDRFNKRLRALGIDFDIKDINSGKAFEQYAFCLLYTSDAADE